MNKKALILFVVALAFLAACKNNNDAPLRVLNTNLDVVNVSNDTLNLYLNGTRLTNQSSLPVNSQSGYLGIPEGTQNFQFKKAGSANVLFSAPFTLSYKLSYSLFVTDETAGGSFITVDTTTIDTGSVAMIRFVNASANVPNVNVTIAGDTVQFNNCTYKTATKFVPVPSGNKSFTITYAGSAPITGFLPLEAGTIYTLYTRQIYNNKSYTFGAGYLMNELTSE